MLQAIEIGPGDFEITLSKLEWTGFLCDYYFTDSQRWCLNQMKKLLCFCNSENQGGKKSNDNKAEK